MITSKQLWAKLEHDANGCVVRWHSLVDHSADVSAVLLTLLHQPTISRRLARLAGRTRLDPVTCARLGVLAFLHDIGKANRGFRARVNKAAPVVGHIDQVAWLFHTDSGASYHERLDAVLGLSRLFGWFASDTGEDLRPTDDAFGLWDAVFAHHGRPWRRADPVESALHWRLGADGDPIADLQPIRMAMDRWFSKAFQAGETLPTTSAFHHAFAGLLMLADWLGSDVDLFPMANGETPDRFTWACERAHDAIAKVGLHVDPARADVRRANLTFQNLFSGREPRPLQADIVFPNALCVVAEAETGSGKTEAALWRFKHLFEQGSVDGLYFALPTRVAASAMFERVKTFRDRLFGGSPPIVVLAVPGQAAVDEAEGRPLPNFGFEWDDEPDHGASQTRWAAEHPKRFLAAPIAVGTIDQALLGSIRVKHSQMRGAALMRQLLVVDEVHASDRYMEALLRGLLHNHTQAGGHALLLSATLGAAARARLLDTPCPDAVAAEAVPYPALSWAEAGREIRLRVNVVDGVIAKSAKQVSLEIAPAIDRPDAIARLALDAAKPRGSDSGAKVLVIRNTVADAVLITKALEALAGPDHPALFRVEDVVTVHHGRFAAPDRRKLDAAVEEVLGETRQTGGRIVAGTQTLEVSLDLDADLLITDLCPIDVLLQRIGRLHRHKWRTNRPSSFADARVIVLVPELRDLLPFARRSGGRHGLGSVYDDLRVLEATWRLIEDQPHWSIPQDNRRLVERATHPSHLEKIAVAFVERDSAWSRHEEKVVAASIAQRQAASSAGLSWNSLFAEFRLDEDEYITTRLGTQDRQVDLPPSARSAFNLPVTSLRVRHDWLTGVPLAAEPSNVICNTGTVWFEMGEQGFAYDRFGLNRPPVPSS